MDQEKEKELFSNFADRVNAVVEILHCEWSEHDDIRALGVAFNKAFPDRDIGDWIEEEVFSWEQSDMIDEEVIDEGGFLIPE